MTLQEKYYAYHLDGLMVTNSEEIVFKIIQDLKNRGGLEDAWCYIDDEIVEEIIEQWIKIAESTKKKLK